MRHRQSCDALRCAAPLVRLLLPCAVGCVRRSTALLLERRASEVLALTSAALNRDMKGAWLTALAPMVPGERVGWHR